MNVGQIIGPFEIVRELGSGAMGAVFLARYTKTDVLVAIKVMNASLGSNERALARFEREADVLKQLKHPHIVRLLATGKYKKSPFYAMEYIEGENLDEMLQRRGRFAWDEVVEIGKQVCAALQHAHSAGIVHRDLKPSNLMMTEDGTVKLTDFGIAKDLDVTGLTTANHTVGTASYMSPEQCRGERDITQKSDLYSLGVVLYELLTGRKPFLAETVMDMFIAHTQGRFERPGRIVFDIPVWLDTLVCQLLEKKPELRPRDAAMVAEVLSEIRTKAETLKSAGADAARAVARRSTATEDRSAAQTLLRAGKKKKRRSGMSKKAKEWWFKAIGLSILLAAMILIIAYLLWPDPARDLKTAKRDYDEWEALMQAENFDDAQAKAYDLEARLKKVILNTGGEARQDAERMLDMLEVGALYIKVHRMASGKKEWADLRKQVIGHNSEGFEEVYARLLRHRPQGNHFAKSARKMVEPLEAPALLAEARLLEAKGAEGWADARAKLDTLLTRYPESSLAAQARRMADRVTAKQREAALANEWTKAIQTGAPYAGISPAREQAFRAWEKELNGDASAAQKNWKSLADIKPEEIADPDEKTLPLLARYKLGQLEDHE